MRMILFGFIILLNSCQSELQQQPRPHQFPRLEFPNRDYVEFNSEDCPFTMDIPNYASVLKKELIFDEVAANPCWFDIDLTPFNATLHCSYYAVGDNYKLDKLIDDAFTMASKHNVKASFREEFVIRNKYDASGLIFKINGPVATPYQFYITDSTNHFLRGSLYFNEQVDRDSIGPILDYMIVDVEQSLNTLNWQE